MKNDNDLFYTCSLIEFIGRKQKLNRNEVVDYLGKENLKRIYKYAGTLHCEPIEAVANEYVNISHIPSGDFDNVSKCRYEVPDYWTIGEVYARLIEDAIAGDMIETLIRVYHSWISDAISNYNSDFFYQSREYIAQCYKNNELI